MHSVLTLKRLFATGFHRFLSLHLVPRFFIASPLHTPFFSSFLSRLPVFMSFHLILSFVRVHICPDLSVYVHIYTYFKHRVRVAQVFTMKWVFVGCPCALGSL